MRKVELGGGRISLYQGDCFEILAEISGADAVITDPPYFLSLANDMYGKLNPWANLCNGAFFVKGWLSLCLEAPKTDCVVWSFTNWQGFAAFQKAGYETGCPVRSLLVWDKDTLGPGVIGLRPSYELVAMFARGKFKISNRSVSDIFRCAKGGCQSDAHPAQKPLPLLGHLVKISSAPNNIIIDPFMGSGSTGVAAVKHGRKFIGIEQDPKWFDVACGRIQEALDQRRLLDLAS